MKRNHLIGAFISILCFSSLSYSQDIEVVNGSEFKVSLTEDLEQVIYADDEKTTFLTQAGLFGNKFSILNFDDKLNVIDNRSIELPEIKNKEVEYMSSTNIAGKPFIFSRYYDRKMNKYFVFSSEVDTEKASFKKHYELVEVKDDDFKKRRNPFTTAISEDSTKVVFLTEYPTKRNENVKYGVTVLDRDMKELWSKDIRINEKDKDFRFTSIKIDKKGNIHFAARLRMSREEKRDADANSRYYYNVYSYFHEEEELKQYEVGFKDEIMSTLRLTVDDNDQLVGMGFYSERKIFGGYKGFFYFRVNPETQAVEATNLSPFDKDLIASLYNNERQGKRKADKGKFPPYTIRKSIGLSDGKIAVIAEHYFRTESDERISYLFGNVVVMFLDSEGKMTTAQVIKKKQYATSKVEGPSLLQMFGLGLYPGTNEVAYYGISIIQKDDDIYILYNDNPKNKERLKEGKKPRSVRKRNAVTQLMKCSADGSQSQVELFKAQDRKEGQKMPLMPRSYTQYSNNSTIILGRNGRKMRASRITIQ